MVGLLIAVTFIAYTGEASRSYDHDAMQSSTDYSSRRSQADLQPCCASLACSKARNQHGSGSSHDICKSNSSHVNMTEQAAALHSKSEANPKSSNRQCSLKRSSKRLPASGCLLPEPRLYLPLCLAQLQQHHALLGSLQRLQGSNDLHII